MAMASTPTKVNSAFTTILDQPPSCLEFSPAESAVFVVGTYCLESTEGWAQAQAQAQAHAPDPEATGGDSAAPASQSRSGSLVLFQIDGESLHVYVVTYQSNTTSSES